jgi:hypothetical protein
MLTLTLSTTTIDTIALTIKCENHK